MSMRARPTNPTPWGALFFALLGLAWCGYIAFPTANPAPCATAGCALFRDSRVAGLSLWWIGGAYFFLLAVTCLRGNLSLARFMARAALITDTVLMLVMLFTAPCLDCLVVAAFLGLTFFALRPTADGWFLEEPKPSLLLPIWFGLFLGNAVPVADELLPHYTMGNTSTADVRVYFAPSCPACREAILSFGNSATLYPVEEKEGDTESIIKLASYLKDNVPIKQALARSIDPREPVPPISWFDQRTLAVQLLRNKATVLRQKFKALPLIQVNGMPGRKPGPDGNVAPRSTPSQPDRYMDGTSAAPSGAANTAPHSEGDNSTLPPQDHRETRPDNQSPRDTTRGTPQNARGEQENSMPDFLRDVNNLGQCAQGASEPCD